MSLTKSLINDKKKQGKLHISYTLLRRTLIMNKYNKRSAHCLGIAILSLTGVMQNVYAAEAFS